MSEPTDPTRPGDPPAAETSAGSPAESAPVASVAADTAGAATGDPAVPDPPQSASGDPAVVPDPPTHTASSDSAILDPPAPSASSDPAEHGAPIPFDAPAAAAGIAAPADPGALQAARPASEQLATAGERPSYIFFGVVAAVALAADVVTKAWAEITLSKRTLLDPGIVLVKGHLSFTLAYNKGGAWGLLQTASETIRKPFFLVVSALAIAFIVSLYARLGPGQRALKWGLPLVLGGALGNLSDRIIRASVVDFVDYKAHWVQAMNTYIARVFPSWSITNHWPTFNVADICICVGVALMAVDMLTSRKQPKPAATQVVETGAGQGGAGSGSQLSTGSAGVASDPPSVS